MPFFNEIKMLNIGSFQVDYFSLKLKEKIWGGSVSQHCICFLFIYKYFLHIY